jgi:hypothetical protein
MRRPAGDPAVHGHCVLLTSRGRIRVVITLSPPSSRRAGLAETGRISTSQACCRTACCLLSRNEPALPSADRKASEVHPDPHRHRVRHRRAYRSHRADVPGHHARGVRQVPAPPAPDPVRRRHPPDTRLAPGQRPGAPGGRAAPRPDPAITGAHRSATRPVTATPAWATTRPISPN